MKRQLIRPLSRVEGSGKVLLELENDRLKAVEIQMVEPPRLFESLLHGRSFIEVPALVSRICAICATPHALAAVLALEKATGTTPPPAAGLIREMALLGDLVQSHALHLFALVLPDLRQVDSLVELLKNDDRDARGGLALKKFANQVQELAGGRLVHPVNLIVGGVHRRPENSALQHVADTCRDWFQRLEPWYELFSMSPEQGYSAPCGMPLATHGDKALNLWGDTLCGADRTWNVETYREWLSERSVGHSNAKQVTAPGGTWRTGALARRELSTTCETGPAETIFANNTSQLREIELALNRLVEICDQLAQLPEQALLAVTPHPKSGVGTIALEAPRGTLIHHYGIDDGGRIVSADIITPTTINQVVIEEQLFSDLARDCPHEQLLPRAEQIIRAFDPCISCAVHLIQR